MEDLIVNFANHLYSFLARQYSPPWDGGEGGPPVEEFYRPSEEYTSDIHRSVLMLSFAYRPSFRAHFISVDYLLCTSEYNPQLFAHIFSRVTYRRHSPFKILILCSFISEMYLFIFYRKDTEDISRHYTSPAIECLRQIYSDVLTKIDDPIPKWKDVQRFATLVAGGYDTVLPTMRMEYPWECRCFFTLMEDVLEEQASGPEGASGNSAANAPSSSQESNPSTIISKALTASNGILLETKQFVDQLKKASLTKSDSLIGDEKPKLQGKKSSSQPLKTEAGTKSAESGSQAIASAANSSSVEYSQVSTGKNKCVYEDPIKPVARNLSPSLRTVDEASLPGNRRQEQLHEDRKCEGANESTNNSNTIEKETRSGSSVAKKKSKKNKKKRANK